MARIRNLKPGFFKNAELFDAEKASGLPLRLAYEGLWVIADREGRFKWKPREIKTDILPYDDVDMAKVMDALVKANFIFKYKRNGFEYGWIPTFKQHQFVNKNEAASTLPSPTENVPTQAENVCAPSENSNAPTGSQSAPEIHGEYTGVSGTSDTDTDTDGLTQGKSAPRADAPPSEPASVPKRSRATRWPAEAVIPDDWIREGEMRRVEHGLIPLDLRLEAERFRNYWASKAGGAATKIDWHMTWMNWALDDKKRGSGYGPQRKSTAQIGAELIAELGAGNGSADHRAPDGPDDVLRPAGDGRGDVPRLASDLHRRSSR